jgi:hypothetical protein
MIDERTYLSATDLTPPLRGTIFVLVSEWGESFGALEHALRFAERHGSQIVLIGLLPPESATPDPEVVRALLTAAELGFGVGRLAPPLDEQARCRRLWLQVLWQLQRRVRVAGLPTRAYAFQGDDCTDQLRELIANTFDERVIVVGDPAVTFGCLRDLAEELIARPPCRVAVVRRAAPRCGSLARMLRQLRSPGSPATPATAMP